MSNSWGQHSDSNFLNFGENAKLLTRKQSDSDDENDDEYSDNEQAEDAGATVERLHKEMTEIEKVRSNIYEVEKTINGVLTFILRSDDPTRTEQDEPPPPQMIVYMFHGWTSSGNSMKDKAMMILEEIYFRTGLECMNVESWKKIWFVVLQSPYSFQTEKNQIKENFYWWDINLLDIAETVLSTQDISKYVSNVPPNLDKVTEKCLAVIDTFGKTYPQAAVSLFGHSQGGGMALWLTKKVQLITDNLAGTILVSPLPVGLNELESEPKKFLLNPSIPMLVCQGTNDEVLPYVLFSKAMKNFFEKTNCENVTYITDDRKHDFDVPLLRHLVTALSNQFKQFVGRPSLSDFGKNG